MKSKGGLVFRIVLYGALAVLAILSFGYDAAIAAWAKAHPEWEQPMGRVSEYGDWPYLMLYAAVLLLLGWKFGVGWRRLIVAMIICSTLAGLAVNTLRLTTGRTRPSVPAEEQGWYGPSKIGRYKFNSFPSGHTATAVGFAAPLVFTNPVGLIAGIALALLMVFARIVVGAHHASDTIWSLLISIAVVDICRALLLPRVYAFLPFLRRRESQDLRPSSA